MLLLCREGKFVEPLEKAWHLGSVQRWETDRQRMECDKEMEAENKQILKGYYVEEGWTRPRRVMGELLERVLMFAFRAERCAKGTG